jgi:aryl-alcohol dehydrogenase-like predicted oxidoreductase
MATTTRNLARPATERFALAWLWARSQQTLPIPGFKTIAQVEENCVALQHPLLKADA